MDIKAFIIVIVISVQLMIWLLRIIRLENRVIELENRVIKLEKRMKADVEEKE